MTYRPPFEFGHEFTLCMKNTVYVDIHETHNLISSCIIRTRRKVPHRPGLNLKCFAAYILVSVNGAMHLR